MPKGISAYVRYTTNRHKGPVIILFLSLQMTEPTFSLGWLENCTMIEGDNCNLH